MKYLLPVLLLVFTFLPAGAQTDLSRQSLDRAKDYFIAGKYHESLIEFLKLDKEYNLSTHYYAYMGLCFYKEDEFEKACQYYGKAEEYIEACAPSERSLYLYTMGDSRFRLGQYSEARSCFEKMLDVCRDEEKADVYYHIGFCQFFTGEHEGALYSFHMSLRYYRQFPHVTGTAARLTQLEKMIAGLENQLNNKTDNNAVRH